jgi:nitric oxide reductase NorD protein
MEEWVGEIWHKMITRKANTEHLDAKVQLTDISSQLAPYFRALGGEHHKTLETAPSLKLNFKRSLVQRIAGTHQRTELCWQDDRSVRFPTTIANFAQSELNLKTYFWLSALSAELPKIQHWFVDNQQATLTLITRRPGLKRMYQELVTAYIATRPALDNLTQQQLIQEQAVRQALLEPGSVSQLPYAEKDPYPVILWIYPAPLTAVQVAAQDDDIEEDEAESAPSEVQKIKGLSKRAQRIDDAKETDGLLMFMAESLASWTEQVELDRPQDESLDQDLSSAAEDMDFITLAKQRRASSAKLKFDLDLPAPYSDDLAIGDGIKLPEWDYRKGKLKQDYCLLQPMLADDALPQPVPEALRTTARKLRNRFSTLRPQQQWLQRQPFGSELDLNAWVDNAADPQKLNRNQDLYLNRSNAHRDLSCLLLADLSMSTDSALNADQRVIDVIRDSILLFAEALDSAGDPFAIYGFSSIKNKQVRFNLLKNFAEKYSDAARGRILAVKPGFYTRMGAGIRQATNVLATQRTEQRLLLLISDGKPNDIDHYEGRYGVEDTRQAILMAKKQGIQPFCITIDEEANDYLPYLFGEQGFAVISDITSLPKLLPKLYLNLTGLS